MPCSVEERASLNEFGAAVLSFEGDLLGAFKNPAAIDEHADALNAMFADDSPLSLLVSRIFGNDYSETLQRVADKELNDARVAKEQALAKTSQVAEESVAVEMTPVAETAQISAEPEAEEQTAAAEETKEPASQETAEAQQPSSSQAQTTTPSSD